MTKASKPTRFPVDGKMLTRAEILKLPLEKRREILKGMAEASKESKPGAFDAAIAFLLKGYKEAHGKPGPPKDPELKTVLYNAATVLEAAGECHPWQDMDLTCDMSESDIRRISRAIWEAHQK